MKFKIEHEIKGRMRVHLFQKTMSFKEADILQYYLTELDFVTAVKVYERSQNVAVSFTGDRKQVIDALRKFQYDKVNVPESYIENSGREVNREYWDKLVNQVVIYAAKKLFLPYPVRSALTAVKSLKYIKHGIQTLAAGKIEVPVLDGLAIGVSVFRADYDTASSVMFLLGIGETLEEWTHKKSVGDLARSMSLNVQKVWMVSGDNQVLVSTETIKPGDEVVVHMGSMIPFDGVVTSGEAMVNQASLTGESMPVEKNEGKYVYAGTVVEEGEVIIRVKETKGGTKFEKIVTMIEETEKLKSSVESKAEHLADNLVPYTLVGTGLTYLITRNVTKALAVLMVDFSCALKLAMPIAVLSAIREANMHSITVKGGKFLEAVAEADTIVFDKTGTLTKAEPTVVDVVPFIDVDPDELLKLAACMEEHFPHSMAKAVVDAAKKKNLTHEEKHSKVNYIVAHGISTMVDGKKAIIGSYHFVFDDEGCVIPEGMEERFENLPRQYSHLFLCLEGVLAAVICVEDPVREEAPEVIRLLKEEGFKKIVMMTGDSKRAARSIAKKVGVDEFYFEVLPEDKAKFVEAEKKAGRKVIMIGDGINDSPALSAADAGIAISDGAAIAREVSDITIGADNLYGLVTLKRISNLLMKRIGKNYREIIGINGALIALGVGGIVQPTTSALVHNASTLAISLGSMKNLIE
ncbi:MAG: heavy metal translocating P-type ATPase [Lachnospiraceae bacterium]|nr:heavy metal translocating P-type ATPase [Lachnospiraceae bacterium]